MLGAAALVAEETAHPLEAVDALEDAWGHELALEGSLPLRQKQVSGDWVDSGMLKTTKLLIVSQLDLRRIKRRKKFVALGKPSLSLCRKKTA